MSPPLYLGHEAPNSPNTQMHAGLWWDKFFNRYEEDFSVSDEAKAEWVSRISNKKILPDPSEAFIQRQLRLGHTLGATQRAFQTEWHFVTGTGLSHPVENGFSWHPTLGLPFLAGSSIKGLLRAWVEEWADLPDRDEILRAWFGCDDEGQEKAGDLTFFDALPLGNVGLTPDIITPHMGKWYEQGDTISSVDREPEKVPADWHSPIPIHFLVVKQGTFLFQIATRNRADASVAERAMRELERALEFLGAGAKTAVGYGRMKRCEWPKQQSEFLGRLKLEAKRLAPQTELEFVSMIAVPSGNCVRVASQDRGDNFLCHQVPTDEARDRWRGEQRDFLALVTRRGERVIRAVLSEW